MSRTASKNMKVQFSKAGHPKSLKMFILKFDLKGLLSKEPSVEKLLCRKEQ